MPVNITDVSSNNLHLSNSGDVQYRSEGLTPFYRFSGANYLYYPDATATEFNVVGNEAYVNDNGLTLMCWARVQSVASQPTLIAKEGGSINQYGLLISTTSNPAFRVSTDGSTLFSVLVPSASFSLNEWIFYCGVWIPSTSVRMYVNDGVTTNAGGPATLYTGAAVFSLGSRNGSNRMSGDISMAGVYASALTEDQILTIYEMTAPLFKPSI